MGFISLYRKYRPLEFSDLVGQEQVVRTLKNSIKYDRIAHAYLFAGPRGTGKTSTAKVYARALNCTDDSSVEPCGKCDNCQRIEAGQSMDVIEIDAASNRGIDEIRELREQVKYQPGEGIFKVYIIDEVHMLTDQAFNALLKTLEEPPENVVFILATTEPHKVISTVLSRCQRFDFTLLTEAEIAERLGHICQQEEVEYEQEALNIIAYSSNGGMRDAISILDQAISYCAGSLNARQVEDMLGKIDTAALSQYINNIAENDAASALQLTQELQQRGRSVDRIVADLLDYVRQILLAVSGGFSLAASGLSEIRREQLQEDSQLFTKARAGEILDQLIELDSQLRYSDRPDILLESTLINLAEGSAGSAKHVQSGDEKVNELAEKVSRLEKKLSAGEFAKTAAEVEKIASQKTAGSPEKAERESGQLKPESESNLEQSSAAEESLEGDRQGQKAKDSSAGERSSEKETKEIPWQEIMSRIQAEDITTHAKLKESLPPRLEDGKLVIEFPADKAFHCRQAKTESDFIGRIINEIMEDNITPVIQLRGEEEVEDTEICRQDEPSHSEENNSSSEQNFIEELQQRLGGQIIKVSTEALKKSEGGKNNGYEKNDAESSADAEEDAAETGGTGR